MASRVLSGMRPTGQLHIGNYRGAAQQFLELQSGDHECFFFVADLHALTEVDGYEDLEAQSVEVVRSYMACGIDPDKCVLYRQSHVPEISEMMVLLGNIATLAELRRCTTYKGKCDEACVKELRDRKEASTEEESLKMIRDGNFGTITLEERHQIGNRFSYGLLGYPILMAADILAVRSHLVPVGADQRQHVEFARDFARTFNSMFKRDVFTIPMLTEDSSVTVPGIDGTNKMSKSGKKSIALLDSPKVIRDKVMGMPMQAEPVGPRSEGTSNFYRMLELFCPVELADEFLRRYGNPNDKYFGEMKGKLADRLIALLEPIQKRYAEITVDQVRDVLVHGAQKVRPIARSVLEDMQSAIGLIRR